MDNMKTIDVMGLFGALNAAKPGDEIKLSDYEVKGKEKENKTQFYVEVTDERVDLDPPYVWQSEVYETKEEVTKAGRRLAQALDCGDISTLLNSGDYLNPHWEKSAEGVEKFLHVDVMIMEFYDETDYDIVIEENIK